MKRLIAGLGLCLLTLALPSALLAQDGPSEVEVIDVVTRDSGLVEFTVAVPGGLAGIPVPDSAWAVLVDGVARPLRIEALPNDELDIVLTIDISGSMEGAPLAAAKEAAVSFIRVLPPTAQVAVVGFDDEAFVAAPFGSTPEEAAAAVDSLAVDGDTALYDGLDLSFEQFALDRGSRRTVVVLTDGKDTASQLTLEQTVQRVVEAETDVYAVALLTDQTDLASLEALVAPTAGRVVTAADTASLTGLYDNIAAVLGSQYHITFEPLTDNGGEAALFVNYLGVGGQGTFEFEARPQAAPPGGGSDEATPAPVQEELVPIRTSVTDPSWISGSGGRLLGVVLMAAAIGVIGLLLFMPGSGAVRLADRTRDRVQNAGPVMGGAKDRATDLADRLLERQGRGRVVGQALERAGVDLRPAEFVVLVLAIAVAAGMLGVLFGSLLFAFALPLIVVAGFRAGVSYMAARRSQAFEEQLPSTLQLLAGSLRAGYALPQAAELIGREAASPTSDEFHRLTTEHRLGRDFGESLAAMSERVDVDDFKWVVQAIGIHREVGGDLAEVLDNINGTIRDRNYIRRQFAALSAEGRYSAYLIVALPFVVLAATSVLNPEYSEVLFTDPRGRTVLVASFISIIVGGLWMKRLIRVRY